MKRHVDKLLQSLVLIRIGQDLGHDSKLACVVHDLIDMLANLAASFFS